MNQTKHIHVTSRDAAWSEADRIIPTDYEIDARCSAAAGYDVYRSTVSERYYCYICDLGDRLEVNLDDGSTVNVWIDEPEDVQSWVLGVSAYSIGCGVYDGQNVDRYEVRLANGQRLQVLAILDASCESGYSYRIGTQHEIDAKLGQLFFSFEYAKQYLQRRIAECMTGVRIVYERCRVPALCGSEEWLREHPETCARCRTMLSTTCPLAIERDAAAAGLKVCYAVR